MGPVVVKHYRRGGLIGRLIRQRYLKWGPTRSQAEYELLREMRRLGICVPEPLVFASRGLLLYRAWLVLRAIRQPQSLAHLSLIDEGRARDAMRTAIEQIGRLVDHGILHVDLHPGNVLVDQTDRVYLIDFDRGHRYRGSHSKLRDRYLSRWHRAVVKYGLPPMLNEMLRSGLPQAE